MKIIDCVQGSDEWLRARLGIVTASELDALVAPSMTPRKGAGVDTYLCKKLAEKWRGAPLTSFHGGMMEQGTIRQDEAIARYELDFDETIRQVGFILSDDGVMGCSPDGLLKVGGIEIKSPSPHTHTGYLLDNELPADYRAQVYGSMLVTGEPCWKFMSYCRGFPPLVLTVESDPFLLDVIRDAVAAFKVKYDRAWDVLVDRNGGPPARDAATVASGAWEDEEFIF